MQKRCVCNLAVGAVVGDLLRKRRHDVSVCDTGGDIVALHIREKVGGILIVAAAVAVQNNAVIQRDSKVGQKRLVIRHIAGRLIVCDRDDISSFIEVILEFLQIVRGQVRGRRVDDDCLCVIRDTVALHEIQILYSDVHFAYGICESTGQGGFVVPGQCVDDRIAVACDIVNGRGDLAFTVISRSFLGIGGVIRGGLIHIAEIDNLALVTAGDDQRVHIDLGRIISVLLDKGRIFRRIDVADLDMLR